MMITKNLLNIKKRKKEKKAKKTKKKIYILKIFIAILINSTLNIYFFLFFQMFVLEPRY